MRLRWSLYLAIQRRGVRTSRSFEPHPHKRALEVAIIGAPNVGKSLLTNQLVRAAVSAVSSKMDTTTSNVCAAVTEDDVQLVVVDSPGTIGITHSRQVVTGKHGGSSILEDPETAVKRAEHILVVQDATSPGDYIHHRVQHLLHRHSHIPSSLVINKVDLVKQRADLLELTRILTKGQVGGTRIKTAQWTIGSLGQASDGLALRDDDLMAEKSEEWQSKYRSIIATPTSHVGFAETKRLFMEEPGWGNFSSVFFTSALTGEGIEPLREHLKSLAQNRQWSLDENTVTTKRPQTLCISSVRAALLDTVYTDVAYKMQPKISMWEETEEGLAVGVDLEAGTARVARKLTDKIEKVTQRVNDHMGTLFQKEFHVRIHIKVKGKPFAA